MVLPDVLAAYQTTRLYLELEFFLLPTVSRPVSLGIGPPFWTLDQILALLFFLFDNYVILLSMRPL
jgi:hypothetical protein